MLGSEPSPGALGEREHDINRGIMAGQQGGMGGVPYAYNLPNQAHLPPSVDSSFYPSPWAAPGYGIFPFGPPGMMMPGLPPGVAPPATDFSTNDIAPPITYLDRRKDASVNSPPIPPTRERFSYTRYQLELLAAIYKHIRYPNSMQKQLVAKRVGITREQVKVWFQNRRRKDVVGKTSVKDEYLQTTARRMVPTDVIGSVLDELLAYKNNDKEKKVKHAMNLNLDEKKRKAALREVNGKMMSPASTGTDTNVSLSSDSSPSTTGGSPLCDAIFADVYQQNGDTVKQEQSSSETGSYPSSRTSDIISDANGSLLSPTLGQGIALSVPHTLETPSHTSTGNHQNGDVLLKTITGIGSLTPLTTIVTDTDSNDSSSTHQSSVSRRSSEVSRSSEREDSKPTEFVSSIDILGPPNTIVIHPHSVVSLKRSRSEDSSSEEDDAEVEPPRKRQECLARTDGIPPNAVAPFSGPIRFSPSTAIDGQNPLSVQVPRHRRSPEEHLDPVRAGDDKVLTTVSSLPDPLSWPPPQWAPRPTEGPAHVYHVPALPTDAEFGQYSRDSPYAVQTLLRSSSGATLDRDVVRDLYCIPQIGAYPWDRTSGGGGDNGVDSATKQNCDKSLLNQISFLSPECSKLGSFAYDNTSCYPPMANGRQDVFTPWMSYPNTCPSFVHPIPQENCTENGI